MGLSDDLGKLDTYVEGVTRKIANYLKEVLEDQRDKLAENLLANNSNEISHARLKNFILLVVNISLYCFTQRLSKIFYSGPVSICNQVSMGCSKISSQAFTEKLVGNHGEADWSYRSRSENQVIYVQ